MKGIFVNGHSIFSPLGVTSAENFERIYSGYSSVVAHKNQEMSEHTFYASLFDPDALRKSGDFSRFESLLIHVIDNVIRECSIDPSDAKNLLIISTTKGNISLLEKEKNEHISPERLSLSGASEKVAKHFGFVNSPLVISNACISGLVGIITAKRLIESGKFENIVVAGADVISKFILSGFESFQAVSNSICRPFDIERKGINLGEGAAAVVISNENKKPDDFRITAGVITNDANHISGPSRTGQELANAINLVLSGSNLEAGEIDYISAHGTATLYNDEMEARAFNLTGLSEVPVNSLKGYYGHTLGAAGLIETVIALESMKNDLVLPSLGYEKHGVSVPLNVCTTLLNKRINHVLKTASGFGGCNAAIILKRA